MRFLTDEVLTWRCVIELRLRWATATYVLRTRKKGSGLQSREDTMKKVERPGFVC